MLSAGGASRKPAQDQIALPACLGTSFSCNSDFVRQWLGRGGRDLLFSTSRLKAD